MIEPKHILKKISRTPVSYAPRIGKILRLDHNERTTPLEKKMVMAVLRGMSPEEFVAYPELGPLYKKLSKFLGVTTENILLCPGSDPGIKSLFEVYVEPGDEVIMLTPSYGMFFVYCDIFGAVKVPVGYRKDFSLPVRDITSKITPKTKLLLLANPNHTGTAMSPPDLCAVIEAAAKVNALVLVDEAYHYFCKDSMIPFIKKYDNLIIVRTLSKAFGIAALRVGVLISQPGNIRNLDKVKPTHEVTSVSAKFAEYLIDHPRIYKDYVRDVAEGKELISRECKKLGCVMMPSLCNFVFIRLPAGVDGGVVVEKLKKKKIYIKGPFREDPVDGMIRVTVGPAEQMKVFIKALKQVLSG